MAQYHIILHKERYRKSRDVSTSFTKQDNRA